MIYTQTIIEDLRDIFINSIIQVFGDDSYFMDFLESEDWAVNYDVFVSGDGENYIIDRNTGEYINWYKETHLGRDIHINVAKPFVFEYTTEHNRYEVLTWFNNFLRIFKSTAREFENNLAYYPEGEEDK